MKTILAILAAAGGFVLCSGIPSASAANFVDRNSPNFACEAIGDAPQITLSACNEFASDKGYPYFSVDRRFHRTPTRSFEISFCYGCFATSD